MCGGKVVYSILAMSVCVCGGGEVVYSTLSMSLCVWGGGRLCTVY